MVLPYAFVFVFPIVAFCFSFRKFVLRGQQHQLYLVGALALIIVSALSLALLSSYDSVVLKVVLRTLNVSCWCIVLVWVVDSLADRFRLQWITYAGIWIGSILVALTLSVYLHLKVFPIV